jgi:hypothetical protein
MKSIRGLIRQLLGDAARGLAINGKTPIPVVVIEIPAEALLAHFNAQVIAGGNDAGLRKTFDNCDDMSATLGGYLPRHFEWCGINSFVHRSPHPSLSSGLRTK